MDVIEVIELLDQKYEIIRDDNCFRLDQVKEKVTDYFQDYDYICGDFAYDKLRLKGFYDDANPKAKDINNIKYLDQYIIDYCNYGSKIFLLKKVK